MQGLRLTSIWHELDMGACAEQREWAQLWQREIRGVEMQNEHRYYQMDWHEDGMKEKRWE